MRDEESEGNRTEDERKQTIQERREMASAGAMGLQFGISVAIGAFGGNWLDKQFDTAPWLVLTGIVLGAAAGFRDLYLFAKKQEEKNR
jgi:ATP synthase protein I